MIPTSSALLIKELNEPARDRKKVKNIQMSRSSDIFSLPFLFSFYLKSSFWHILHTLETELVSKQAGLRTPWPSAFSHHISGCCEFYSPRDHRRKYRMYKIHETWFPVGLSRSSLLTQTSTQTVLDYYWPPSPCPKRVPTTYHVYWFHVCVSVHVYSTMLF